MADSGTFMSYPWLCVDLGKEALVYSVGIFNRYNGKVLVEIPSTSFYKFYNYLLHVSMFDSTRHKCMRKLTKFHFSHRSICRIKDE